jgi:putative flippase GtrA
MMRALIPFVSVGALAAFVHYLAALAAFYVDKGLTAAVSNWIGFFCAFPVSYMGHRYWTFKATQVSHISSFIKFFLVALLGFLANQALLWSLLHYTPLPFWFALALVMVVVAVSTYVLSKGWVFVHSK